MNSVTSELNSNWRQVDWVLTDVDDTLTWEGRLLPETLIALQQLRDSGKKVVAVTGACAGWCDHIAQLWPVDAVLGENGAFIMEKKDSYLTLRSTVSLEEIRQQQQKLKRQIQDILLEYPDLSLTLDQSYRLCEVAIDIGQNRARVAESVIEEIVAKIHGLGAHATASSIHINAWYGEHSKKVTAVAFLSEKGLSQDEIRTRACYVGDSMNDQYMFEILPNSVGVANIKHYWERLAFRPSTVMNHSGGYGFAEFTQKLLAIK